MAEPVFRLFLIKKKDTYKPIIPPVGLRSGQTHALADAQRRSKPPPGLSIARPERGSHVSQAGGHPAPPQRRPGPQGAFLTHSCSLVSYTPMPRSRLCAWASMHLLCGGICACTYVCDCPCLRGQGLVFQFKCFH